MRKIIGYSILALILLFLVSITVLAIAADTQSLAFGFFLGIGLWVAAVGLAALLVWSIDLTL